MESDGGVGVAPVREGDVVEVEIIGVGDRGDELGKLDNFVLMIKRPARVGQRVQVRVRRVFRKFAIVEELG